MVNHTKIINSDQRLYALVILIVQIYIYFNATLPGNDENLVQICCGKALSYSYLDSVLHYYPGSNSCVVSLLLSTRPLGLDLVRMIALLYHDFLVTSENS